ncbi:hypothetical protein CGZ80_22375, partial [Rhodopirellula sp. MGV]
GNGPDGLISLVWLDLRSGSTEIYYSQSLDSGETWSKNVVVYRSPSGTVCECCHPSIAIHSDGQRFVMWRNVIEGDRDMYVATSSDGHTFNAAEKLGNGSWQLDACPMDGGALVIDSKAIPQTVWRRQNTIYLAAPGQRFETLIGNGQQPWIAKTQAGNWIVWLSQRGGNLLCMDPEKQIRTLASNAAAPVIVTGGHHPITIACWEEQQDNQSSIKLQVLNRSGSQTE